MVQFICSIWIPYMSYVHSYSEREKITSLKLLSPVAIWENSGKMCLALSPLLKFINSNCVMPKCITTMSLRMTPLILVINGSVEKMHVKLGEAWQGNYKYECRTAFNISLFTCRCSLAPNTKLTVNLPKYTCI